MNFIKKWYTYQKERFPVLMFGIYILSIVIAVFSFGNFNNNETINYTTIVPMFLVAFLQFLMVRIVDEFKDYEEDCKYRSYRPVPRGLITLHELKVLFIICVILQFTITILYGNGIISIILLGIMWLYFVIMSEGFFIKSFLDKHILIEVWLDEIMMPIMIAFLLTFTPYMNDNASIFMILPNANVPVYMSLSNAKYLLAMSYIVSCIVEVARKIRAKEQEEKGVKTYTAVFGIPKAILLLTTLEAILSITQYLILRNMLLPIMFCIPVIIINILFVVYKNKQFAKGVELLANIFIMLVYLSMFMLIV